jgi:uncharacterized protein (TIGR00159 family)
MDTAFSGLNYYLWLLGQLSPSSVLDILLVAAIVFFLLETVQGTSAAALLRGALILFLLVIFASTLLNLTTLSWVLRNGLPAMLIAVPIVFQPELRRALERLGRTSNLLSLVGRKTAPENEAMVNEVVRAVDDLARLRHGALIVIERSTKLNDVAAGGIPIDGRLTAELLANIFYPNSPLHDGAVILRQARILAASVVLPLGEGSLEYRYLGMRHRAAVGVSEQTDAVAVVVSEETGKISIAVGGTIFQGLAPEELRTRLFGLLGFQADRSLVLARR